MASHKDLRTLMAAACAAALSGPAANAADVSNSFIYATGVEPEAMDSASSYNANNRAILGNVFEALVARDPKTNELIPELAESWERVDDHTYVFKLRESVTFHDGTPLNAETAAASLSYVWSAENNFRVRSFMASELTFAALDEYMLQVQSAEPDPLLATRMWFSYLPSPTQIATDPEAYKTTPIGTGPYRFVEWDRGNSITLEANPDWWGGELSFKTATFVFRPEPASRIAALQAGEVHFAERLPADPCKEALGEQCIESVANSASYFRLDTMNPVLADPRVRTAMSLATDRIGIGEALLGGAPPAAMIVGPSATGFNADLTPHDYNLEQAKALIAEAKADGVPVDTTPLVLSSMQNAFEGNQEVLETTLQAFHEIGLTQMRGEMIERGEFAQIFINVARPIPPERGLISLHKHDNDAFDFQTTVNVFYECQKVNSTSCNEEIDRRNALAAQLTGDERQQAYEEIAQIIYEDNNIIPLHYLNRYHGLGEGLEWEPRLDMMVMLKDVRPAD